MRKALARPSLALLVLAVLVTLEARPAHAERLKDIASLLGTRSNQLLGYGLVVGLQNVGDDIYAGIGSQSVATMLRRLGVNVDPNMLRLRNVAAVMVTADLPAFVAPGQRIDVTVSSLGNARSLEGGTLVASPLKGADLKVYAVAQGPLSVGGYSAHGASGSRLQKNITTVARIPSGALVEREVPIEMPTDRLSVTLKQPDFTTAVRLADAVNKELAADSAVDPNAAANPNNVVTDPNKSDKAPQMAEARDSGMINVRVPPAFVGHIPALMARLENLEITPDLPNRVIVNERTGTVVLGDSVRLMPVAIAHGGLTLEVRETPQVSQPGAFSRNGRTVVTPNSQMQAQETVRPMVALAPGASLGDVVKALNSLGVSPRDLVAIMQALKSAGALRADLEIQ